jgi:hypothetical protein
MRRINLFVMRDAVQGEIDCKLIETPESSCCTTLWQYVDQLAQYHRINDGFAL